MPAAARCANDPPGGVAGVVGNTAAGRGAGDVGANILAGLSAAAAAFNPIALAYDGGPDDIVATRCGGGVLGIGGCITGAGDGSVPNAAAALCAGAVAGAAA
jgi:hypothetical protein